MWHDDYYDDDGDDDDSDYWAAWDDDDAKFLRGTMAIKNISHRKYKIRKTFCALLSILIL